jgi:tetratricopeptide (TPR) repeat protein
MTQPAEPQEVRAQLARLSAAEPLASSPQLASFLSYVVEQTLAERGGEIKGYTIAVEGLGRPADFDPQNDPIVRVEARRLRQALRAYYEGAGRGDPIVIDIPTGGYVPVFRRADAASGGWMAPDRASAAASPLRRMGSLVFIACVAALLIVGAAALRISGAADDDMEIAARIAAGHGADRTEPRLPVVRVSVFEALGETGPPKELARRLTDRVIVALSRFDEIRVLGPTAAAGDGEYLLRGRLLRRPDGSVGFGVALHAPGSRELLVAREYPAFQPEDAALVAPDAVSEESALRTLAVEIASPQGVIAADQLARLAKETTEDGPCLYAVQLHWRQPMRERQVRVRDCLRRDRPGLLPPALVEADLAFLALADVRNGDLAESGAPLDRALAHARAAVSAGPSSPRAFQALMGALFLRGQTEEALRAGERATMLNPFDMDLLASYGARLVQSGAAAQGRKALLDAAESMPGRPSWLDFYLVLSALLLEDRAAMLGHADAVVADGDPLGLIAPMIAARERGAESAAVALARRLVAADPRYGADLRGVLALHGFAAPVLERLAQEVEPAIKAAGL